MPPKTKGGSMKNKGAADFAPSKKQATNATKQAQVADLPQQDLRGGGLQMVSTPRDAMA